jgi:hypothetical protein
MTRMPSRIVLTLAAATLALAACSSSGSSSEGTSPTNAATASASSGHTHSHAHAVVPKDLKVLPDGSFDPNKIDLSGVPGVTPEEQGRAELLLRRTLLGLPQWAESAHAEAAGFQSIGDGLTGHEHLIHWDWIDDNDTFDPDHPEALVYQNVAGVRTLEAAMYILPKQYTLTNLPDLGGSLTQFHIHDNLCFTAPPAPKVAGFTAPGQACRAPLVNFNPNAMVHVWLRPNRCGPFAALEGVGAGTIKSGESRSCDHTHSGGGF